MSTTSGSAVDPLDFLEAQVQDLERLVIGDEPLHSKEASILETLIANEKDLLAATAQYPGIKTAFDRVLELDDVLDPTYEDNLVDVSDKCNFVLSCEEELATVVAHLNRANELNKTLQNDKLKNIPMLSDQLKQLWDSATNIRDECKDLQNKLCEMTNMYSSAIMSINQTLASYDTKISNMEIEKAAPKPDLEID